jgi:hypothetical protein
MEKSNSPGHKIMARIFTNLWLGENIDKSLIARASNPIGLKNVFIKENYIKKLIIYKSFLREILINRL